MTARSLFGSLTLGDYVRLLLFLLPVAAAAVVAYHRIGELEKRIQEHASRESVQRIEERVRRLEQAVDDIREIKADVRYILGLLEGERRSTRDQRHQ